MPVHAPIGADRTLLSSILKAEARSLGFDLVGIAPAVTPAGINRLHDWLARGYAGEMRYIDRRSDAYEHPQHVLETVRSVVVLAMNYNAPDHDLSTARPHPNLLPEGEETGEESPTPIPARVSRYAWGDADYHDVLKDRLRLLADFLHQQHPGCRTRGVVDTAPLLERDFARLAGLGWFGKNTMLINKRKGSWLFLAALLTDVELDYDEPHETSHCGTCTRCLDACPTNAFVEPYVLDARRCISYLTIELRDRPIPEELRDGMADWLFGCDVCQDVCPWNRKAPVSAEPAFQPAPDLHPADAVALLRMTDDEFRRRFRHTPLWRPGRAGLLRNAAIVLGNSGDVRGVPTLAAALGDGEPLVRGAAAWALGIVGGDEAINALRQRLDDESDPDVHNEINRALAHVSARPKTR